MARKPIAIDWNVVAQLCTEQCTQEEIAAELGISVDTIQRACQREHSADFAAFFAEKRKRGFVSLRRKQYEQATGGNTTMLIWLGKQYLQQSDKQELKSTSDPLADLLAEFRGRYQALPPEDDAAA